MAASAMTALNGRHRLLRKNRSAVKHAKMETVSHVAGKPLRVAGGFISAFTRVRLSFAGACPALRKASEILGD
jgi:hypothetical protein